MGITAAYVRVSSKAQDHATQRHAIEAEAARRGDVIGEWYAEKQSGRTLERAELKRLRADAVRGRIGKLYVFKLDRLTRSGVADTFELIKELRDSHVELITVCDDYSLTGKAADLILAGLSWAADIERQHISERISAARARVESEGGKWGRPARMTAAQRKEAREEYADGASVREIAIAMKIPRSTLWRCLNPKAAAESRKREKQARSAP